jgi:hypothetical protein
MYVINLNDEYSLFLIKKYLSKICEKQDLYERRFWITKRVKGVLLLPLFFFLKDCCHCYLHPFMHTNEQYYKVKYFVCTMYKLWTKDCDN